MKYYILLLLLTIALLGSTHSSAQPYQSIFGRDSTVWNVSRWVDGNPMKFRVSDYATIGDTVLDGKQYKIIYGDSLSYGYNFISKKFALRENLDSGKVWLRTIDSNREYLIMNLSLNIGDTMRPYSNPIYQYLYFTVDSVYWDVSGRKHVRFNHPLTLPYPVFLNFEYIEGVGNNLGFDAFINQIDDFGLTCQHKDGKLNWKSPYVKNNDCTIGEFMTNGITESSSMFNKITLSPNPCYTDYITIHGIDKHDLLRIDIYDRLGRRIISLQPILEIDMSSLPPGFYTFKITRKDYLTKAYKIYKP